MNAELNAKHPMFEEDRQLGHLCAKVLTGRLQGTLSVGLGIVAHDVEYANGFLENQFRGLEAIATVMSTTGGIPLSHNEVLKLRATASGLREQLHRLHTTLRTLRPTILTVLRSV